MAKVQIANGSLKGPLKLLRYDDRAFEGCFSGTRGAITDTGDGFASPLTDYKPVQRYWTFAIRSSRFWYTGVPASDCGDQPEAPRDR